MEASDSNPRPGRRLEIDDECDALVLRDRLSRPFHTARLAVRGRQRVVEPVAYPVNEMSMNPVDLNEQTVHKSTVHRTLDRTGGVEAAPSGVRYPCMEGRKGWSMPIPREEGHDDDHEHGHEHGHDRDRDRDRALGHTQLDVPCAYTFPRRVQNQHDNSLACLEYCRSLTVAVETWEARGGSLD